jgi:hypothetical protein
MKKQHQHQRQHRWPRQLLPVQIRLHPKSGDQIFPMYYSITLGTMRAEKSPSGSARDEHREYVDALAAGSDKDDTTNLPPLQSPWEPLPA